jgi:hypothetical protein
MSDSQLLRLARPVPGKYIKRAPSGYGEYVDHEIITQILLAIVGPFSFRVEQVVYSPERVVEGCTASLTVTVDGVEVTVTEAGDCDQPGNCKTQGDRLKKAASDALKRCAMRLGLGLHLWAGSGGDFFLYEQLAGRAGTEQPQAASSGVTQQAAPTTDGMDGGHLSGPAHLEARTR